MFLAIGLDESITNEAYSIRFRDNYLAYERVFKKADKKPNRRDSAKTLNTMLKACELRLTEKQKADMKERLLQLEHEIYGSTTVGENQKEFSTNLALHHRASDVKYRQEYIMLVDFVRAQPFIYEICDADEEMRQHLFGDVNLLKNPNGPSIWRFHEFFLKSLKHRIAFKQAIMKLTETTAQVDNYCFYDITSLVLDYCFDTNRSIFASGYGPIGTPHQQ